MLLILNDTELQQRLDVYRNTIQEVVQNLHVIERQTIMGGNGTSILIGPNEERTDVERVRSERDIDEWAAMLSLGNSFSLHLAFNEDWQRVSTDKTDWRRIFLNEAIADGTLSAHKKAEKSQNWWIFSGLRLRFYVRCESSIPPDQSLYQWLRCEWEPYEFSSTVAASRGPMPVNSSAEIAPALIFPGGVAAHPHFHFDSVPLNSIGRTDANNRFSNPGTFMEQGESFSSQLNDGVAPNWLLHSSATALGHLHLPTITSWQKSGGNNGMFGSDIPSANAPLPHQHYPQTTEELDQWFCWCVTYFKHQFEEYIQHR